MLHADLIYRRERMPEGETPNHLQAKVVSLSQPA